MSDNEADLDEARKKIEALEAARDHAFRTRDLFGLRANDERARAEAAELAARDAEVARLREALECTTFALGVATVFIQSREKMHPCGVEIHEEAIAKGRAALAALSRPLPGVVEGVEPSANAVQAVLDGYADTFKTAAGFESPEVCMRSALRLAYAIDLAPRVAAAYASGVEDAAKLEDAEVNRLTAIATDLRHSDRPRSMARQMAYLAQKRAGMIRSLLPKEPATEDAPDNTGGKDDATL